MPLSPPWVQAGPFRLYQCDERDHPGSTRAEVIVLQWVVKSRPGEEKSRTVGYPTHVGLPSTESFDESTASVAASSASVYSSSAWVYSSSGSLYSSSASVYSSNASVDSSNAWVYSSSGSL